MKLDPKMLAQVISEAFTAKAQELEQRLASSLTSLADRLTELSQKVDNLPAPVSGEKGEQGERGERGETGIGERGEKGEAGTAGTDGRDGRDGRDGLDGKDAADIVVHTGIDPERSYARGTFASHRGGLWVSRQKTAGMDGWECVVVGIASVDLNQATERSASMLVELSTGETVEKSLAIPGMVYRGVYRDGDNYETGDVATWAGSAWVKEDGNKEGKPGEGDSGWKLAVKRGRDGKAGEKGQAGERGKDGKDLRYLMQT